MAAQKINEAHEHIAKAEKCLKTSLTKWKPDYDSAASEYSKAAVAFKNAKQFEQAKDAYVKEAEYHTENKAFFFRALEQAGMMMKVSKMALIDMKRMPEAIQYIEKASMMYVENGTPDTAAMALDRAGKLIEPVNVEKAIDLYKKAASVFENEDRLRQAAELLGKSSRLLVRLRRLDEAAASIHKEKNMYKEIENYPTCFKKTIAQVLVHLHRNDFVAADKCVRESYSIPGFSGSEDCVAMEQLLQGYDEQDEDVVNRVCSSPLLKYMDNDYAKLAVTLKVPGGGKKKKSPTVPQGGAGAPAAAEEDDEYEGGLC
uniref:Gamma-soluble NSF attachment protein n=1 Tax=Paramormyrops kingsleyae TaxID=1676925 RepID=A0A3B3S6N1_9TELE